MARTARSPGHRQGETVDTNVETIDILPTLAVALGVRLPWTTDGANVLDPAWSGRPVRQLYETADSFAREVGELRSEVPIPAHNELRDAAPGRMRQAIWWPGGTAATSLGGGDHRKSTRRPFPPGLAE